VRPLLALGELAPKLTSALLERMGLRATLEARTAQAARS